MHVNPKLEKRGLAMVFNPTATTVSRKLILPLYYTGISTEAMILHEGVMPGEFHVLCFSLSVYNNLSVLCCADVSISNK